MVSWSGVRGGSFEHSSACNEAGGGKQGGRGDQGEHQVCHCFFFERADQEYWIDSITSCISPQVISGKIEEITVPEQVPFFLPMWKIFSSSLLQILMLFFKGGRNHIGADGIHAPQRENVGDILARKEVLETRRQNVPKQVLDNYFYLKQKLIHQKFNNFWGTNYGFDFKMEQL